MRRCGEAKVVPNRDRIVICESMLNKWFQTFRKRENKVVLLLARRNFEEIVIYLRFQNATTGCNARYEIDVSTVTRLLPAESKTQVK